ncbi:Signal transduction histidine kinase [Saccharopolyspora antimicrobica]|uniref:histidine kinase n=1 Tax=Saccharopolyspora antimicrobica TaxID=455193 RepID=A0A1I4V879_9PSEU|nr:histidine kinase [Saccharopolyspora antimicrobica]RKT86160.1 signal transduction histidine kinase [Saccharopolyspora antimicrobica]SFM97210.1 Signal transduction histidine kinase [Saccharopolyspora antimicrobica]
MSRGRIAALDWAIAVGVAAALLVAGLSGQHPGSARYLLGGALLVAGGLALVARRWKPVVVLVATGLCALGYQAAGFDVPAVAFLFAVYAVVRAGHRVVAVVASVLMLATLPLAVLASPLDLSVGEAFARTRDVLQIAWLIAAGAAGEALRQAERRAEEAERTREETARRRADEERLHIARELHDSLTHQISVIKVQAEAAVHVAQKRGEKPSEALLAIRQAGREAARELRATLETLREDASPSHGLDHVPELLRRARANGLDAELVVEGSGSGAPPEVERTVYRIVQESLTNIARHAAATTATVRIGYRPGALVVQVDDDGRATSATPLVPGVGLLGMRERVTALGGDLRAAPRSGGGFTVRAEIPLEAA